MPTASTRGLLPVWRARAACAGFFAAVYLCAPVQASAETLSEALAAAYSINPRIQAARATLRATDEALARAQSGYRPTVSAEADYTLRGQESHPPSPSDGGTFTRSYSLTANQPIYNGGSTAAGVKEADATIKAQREVLRETEQQVLLEAVTAYADVIRDHAALDVQKRNVNVLTQELKQVQARFDVGEVTKTDVEQAKAALASARAQSEVAKATLRTSSARYTLVIGHAPKVMRTPSPPNKLLPRSLEDAVAIAKEMRPAVIQAAYLKKSNDEAINKLYGQLLPQVTLNGSLTSTDTSGAVNSASETASLTGRVVVPIYTGGDVQAQIRQQKENRQALLLNIEQARIQAQSDVVTAWAVLEASRAQVEANKQQLDAAKIALEGVKAEVQVGQRTQLDVLNAQQSVSNAEVQLATTKRDIIVNAYRVLQVTGQLSAEHLGLGVETYDVNRHYQDTNGSWWKTTVQRETGYAGIEGKVKP